MTFSIKGYISNNIKELILSGILIIGLIAAIGPASIMINFILSNSKSIFYIKHVSNFFCMLGLYAGVLNSLYFINRDFSQRTNSLINNSKKNRIAYVNANLIFSFIVSFCYAGIGIFIVIVANILGVPGELSLSFLLAFFINIMMLIPIYFLFCYFLFSYGVKTNVVYAVLTVLLLFFPNILSNLLSSTANQYIVNIIENFPLYYLPIYAGSNILTNLQYLIGVVSYLILFAVTLRKNILLEY